MPYNRPQERIEVSDDSLSDVPAFVWHVPDDLAKPHIFRMAQMWLDYARQSIRLKFMVADIVRG
jgi:hypothetical protein